jgi:hypothetical protein
MNFIRKTKKIPARFGVSLLGLVVLTVTLPLTFTAPFFAFQAVPPSLVGTFFLCGIFFVYYVIFSCLIVFALLGTLIGLINKVFKKSISIYNILLFSVVSGLLFGGLMSFAMFQITTNPNI